jgi:hypothetical protein
LWVRIVGWPEFLSEAGAESTIMSMITAIDGAFVSLSDGLPGSASRLL